MRRIETRDLIYFIKSDGTIVSIHEKPREQQWKFSKIGRKARVVFFRGVNRIQFEDGEYTTEIISDSGPEKGAGAEPTTGDRAG